MLTFRSQRSAVWMSVSGAESARQSDPNRYERMKNPSAAERDEAALELIDVDLCRTFPENIYFASETADDAKSLVCNSAYN